MCEPEKVLQPWVSEGGVEMSLDACENSVSSNIYSWSAFGNAFYNKTRIICILDILIKFARAIIEYMGWFEVLD